MAPEAGGFDPKENPVAAVAGAEAGPPPNEKEVPDVPAAAPPAPNENAILAQSEGSSGLLVVSSVPSFKSSSSDSSFPCQVATLFSTQTVRI